MSRFWIIAPVESKQPEFFDKVWQFDLDNNLISIGWSEVGDVSKMSRDELTKAVTMAYPDKPNSTKGLYGNMLWAFWHEIRPGDFVIARKGRTFLAAVGKVIRAGFFASGKNPYLASANYSHDGFLEVEWQQPLNKKFPNLVFPMFTVKEIIESEYRKLVEEDCTESRISPTSEPVDLIDETSAFALEKHLEDFIVKNFEKIFKKSLVMYVDGAGADGQQFDTDIGRIDILAVEPETNSFVVIELKRDSSSDQVIGQVLRYMGWVKKKLCEDGQAVKGLIICHESDTKLSYALEMTNNIEVQYYEVDFKLKKAL
jgi:restriction system protein